MERLPNSVLENAIRVFVIGEKTALEKCVLSFLKELQELRDAEENGLLVRLPCKVGDKLYHIRGKFILESTVYSFNKDGAWIIFTEHYSEEAERTFSMCFEIDAIGKTVFLTKEEAEAKLKEMEGEDGDSN